MDWRRNLDLLVKLNEHLGSDQHFQRVAEVELAAPVQHPGKMLFAGANYSAHVSQFEPQTKSQVAPYVFSKLPESLIGPSDSIVLPDGEDQVDWELELGLIIGRQGRYIRAEHALDHVAGFVVINDITARNRVVREDVPYLRSDWLLSKSVDTFCPMGPYLVPKEFVGDCHDLAAHLWVNGQLYQDFNTSDMIYTPEELIEWSSAVTTLRPGDVFSTGSGPGNGIATGRWLQPGDVVEAEIAGLGRQKTGVVAEQRKEAFHSNEKRRNTQ